VTDVSRAKTEVVIRRVSKSQARRCKLDGTYDTSAVMETHGRVLHVCDFTFRT